MIINMKFLVFWLGSLCYYLISTFYNLNINKLHDKQVVHAFAK